MQTVTMPLYLYIAIVLFIVETCRYFANKYVFSENKFLFYETKELHSTITAKSVFFAVSYSYSCFFVVVLIGNLIS